MKIINFIFSPDFYDTQDIKRLLVKKVTALIFFKFNEAEDYKDDLPGMVDT